MAGHAEVEWRTGEEEKAAPPSCMGVDHSVKRRTGRVGIR